MKFCVVDISPGTAMTISRGQGQSLVLVGYHCETVSLVLDPAIHGSPVCDPNALRIIAARGLDYGDMMVVGCLLSSFGAEPLVELCMK